MLYRRLVCLALLITPGVVGGLFPARDQAQAAGLPDDVFEPDQVEGVLTEARCFFTTGARGDRHKFCGYSSLKAGLPAGLITESGEFVYLILEPKKLASRIDSTIRVRGRYLPGTRYLLPEQMWVKKGSEWERIAVRD